MEDLNEAEVVIITFTAEEVITPFIAEDELREMKALS